MSVMDKIKKPADRADAQEYQECTLESFDPYGFVYVTPHVGRCPEKLSGAYTTHSEAKKAVDLYLKNFEKFSEAAVSKIAPVKPVQKVKLTPKEV